MPNKTDPKTKRTIDRIEIVFDYTNESNDLWIRVRTSDMQSFDIGIHSGGIVMDDQNNGKELKTSLLDELNDIDNSLVLRGFSDRELHKVKLLKDLLLR
jgi:hypothetical protein